MTCLEHSCVKSALLPLGPIMFLTASAMIVSYCLRARFAKSPRRLRDGSETEPDEAEVTTM